MVRREEEASEPGDRHQDQVSPGKGRATTPALTKTQQRGLHPLTGGGHREPPLQSPSVRGEGQPVPIPASGQGV